MIKLIYTLMLAGWVVYTVFIVRRSRQVHATIEPYQKALLGYVAFSIIVIIFISYLIYGHQF